MQALRTAWDSALPVSISPILTRVLGPNRKAMATRPGVQPRVLVMPLCPQRHSLGPEGQPYPGHTVVVAVPVEDLLDLPCGVPLKSTWSDRVSPF
jgi:hypothetical protein